MAQWKASQILDPHCLKDTAVQPKDLVASCTLQSVLLDLESCIQLAKSQALAEVPEEIHHTELHKEVVDFLDSEIMGLPYVGIKVSHHNEVLLHEAEQGLLQI